MNLLFVLLYVPLLVKVEQQSQTRLQQQEQELRIVAAATATTSSIIGNYNIHLLSLQWPSTFSKPVKDVWQWKDSVLGDGRDFFVPKPKTLTALNEYLLQHCHCVDEVSVISNCARFDIIIRTTTSTKKDNPTTAQEASQQISRCLMTQVKSHQNHPFPVLRDQFARFDSPNRIAIDAPLTLHNDDDDDDMQSVMRHWTIISGVTSVTRHLSLVAAGLARRPNRPDRPVTFRPFSSRDAHILLQLKRTPNRGILSLVMNAALSAGKAARDVSTVPQLAALRPYGTGDSKYCRVPPADLLQQAVDAVLSHAIEPAVQDCLQRIQALQMADSIVTLRTATQGLSNNPQEDKWLRQQLHEPTMQLRGGQRIDIATVVQQLEAALTEQRRKRAAE